MLSGKIAERSPVAPEMMSFDDSNIIGKVKIIKHNG